MTPWPIDQLLPHSGPAILLDAITECAGDRIVCMRHLTPPAGTFQRADGAMPAWAGLELMAQAVAAWAGWQARREHRPIRLGFLLGTRHYRSNVAVFPAGSRLTVHGERCFHDDTGMGMFACRVEAAGVLAQARLAVFSPTDDRQLPPELMEQEPPA